MQLKPFYKTGLIISNVFTTFQAPTEVPSKVLGVLDRVVYSHAEQSTGSGDKEQVLLSSILNKKGE